MWLYSVKLDRCDLPSCKTCYFSSMIEEGKQQRGLGAKGTGGLALKEVAVGMARGVGNKDRDMRLNPASS